MTACGDDLRPYLWLELLLLSATGRASILGHLLQVKIWNDSMGCCLLIGCSSLYTISQCHLYIALQAHGILPVPFKVTANFEKLARWLP